MTVAVHNRPVARSADTPNAPARRAIVRWAWRMFRREWRRQALVLALLAVAVAATTVGLAVISNAVQLGADPLFGTANSILTVDGSDPGLAADISATRQQFGTIDVISHQSLAVPGSVSTIDLRAENPDGPYVHPTVRLDSGRYPTGANEVAVTNTVAQTFDLHLGSSWPEGGRTWQVVGLVENPLNLLDQFALVAPAQATPSTSVSILVDASRQQLQSFRFPSGAGLNVSSRGTGSRALAEAVVLVLATVGLLFVGLLAVAGFAVMAQRRLRALGMLSSIGATDRHVRLVMLANGAAVGATSAAVGAVVGLAVWLALAPSLQSVVAHRINRFNLPWWAIGTALVLAFVTALAAAWWPARAVSRIPIVAALSGRPPRPQPAHRFAAAGGLLLGTGLILLSFADENRIAFILTGTVASVVGVLLLAPLAIHAVAKLAGRSSIAIRLALRDLARYQARSGAALGAATLAVAIAATIAISAAAAQGPPAVSNLATNQLNLYVGSGGTGPASPIPVLTPAQQAALQARVDQLAGTLGAHTVLPLDAPYVAGAAIVQPQPGPGGQSGGLIPAALARITPTGQGGENVSALVQLYVATPALLAHYGITPTQVSPTADIITSRADLSHLQIFLGEVRGPTPGGAPAGPASAPSSDLAHPNIQTINRLPPYTSDPDTLLTSHGLQVLGLEQLPAGWLVQTPHPLTTAQINAARRVAASAGLSVETTSGQQSLAPLRNWSTAAGILVALGVLAMTVGLIRSETANDLRTLTATGASSAARRALTGATAGALALLGALIGTAGAYAALLAWHRSNLHPLTYVPIGNLIILLAALPLLATAGGWLLAGREPPAISRQPLE
jgi:putative ABC transport system permease protein